ncbi:DUF5677 domain-containing protein [Roseobacter sp. EG26]|uniref:DUF5677 domain-containing protein n=1 Tax=Roseobacter sp. EG26 TaxID=3412477 RepID=UPI003CE46F6A
MVSKKSDIFIELQDLVVDIAIPLAEEIHFEKRDKYSFALVATYFSILEQSWVILALIDKELGLHSLPHLRAQIEGLAEMKLLLGDESYLLSLELRNELASKQRLINAKRGNPYLKLIAEKVEIESELSRIGKRISELERMGAKKYEMKEKLDKADLKDEREALYGYLSDYSHGSLRALLKRHLQDTGDEDFRVVAFHQQDMSEFDATLHTSVDVILRASQLIHHKFETGHEERFLGLIESRSKA